jgi:hypothetical protein
MTSLPRDLQAKVDALLLRVLDLPDEDDAVADLRARAARLVAEPGPASSARIATGGVVVVVS